MTTQPPPTTLTDEELLTHLDGTLPPEAAAAIKRRIASDPAAGETLDEWQRQDAAVRALYGPVAAELVPHRLSAIIRRAEVEEAARAGGPRRPLMAAVAAVALAFGLAGGWLARDLMAPRPLALSLPAGAMRAHETFVVEVAHPVEVPASDDAHLLSWMSKRLGHDIQPPDLGEAGFALLGGRILPDDGGVAGLFMYEDAAGRRVTLYVAPEGAADETAFQFAEDGGTQSFFWTDRDLSYAVVGDLPRDELRRIAVAAYDQLL